MQDHNAHDYLGGFNAEKETLYNKSGKLNKFLSEWDSKDVDTFVDRFGRPWSGQVQPFGLEEELSKCGNDWAIQLRQLACRRAYVEGVIFWAQKNLERFGMVVASGPFSEEQMLAFEETFIDASISNFNDTVGENYAARFFTPLENT